MKSDKILQIIIDKYGLGQLAKREIRLDSSGYERAINTIDDFLSDKEPCSDTVYIPGGSGVVRVVLTRENGQVLCQSVSTTPENCPKTFAID